MPSFCFNDIIAAINDISIINPSRYIKKSIICDSLIMKNNIVKSAYFFRTRYNGITIPRSYVHRLFSRSEAKRYSIFLTQFQTVSLLEQSWQITLASEKYRFRFFLVLYTPVYYLSVKTKRRAN